jgi:ABC-type bacteriocin/lantibiotic exporters, contain an N-terminal double-glycine peptidase domain
MEKINRENRFIRSSLFEIGKLFHRTSHTMADEEGLRYTAAGSLEEIFAFYKIPFSRESGKVKDSAFDIDAAIKPAGLLKREVSLSGKWWHEANDAFLAKTESNQMIALLPYKGGYRYYDYTKSCYVRVTEENAGKIQKQAYMFYSPLPEKMPNRKSLYRFILSLGNKANLSIVALCAILIALLSLMVPFINSFLFSTVTKAREERIFMAAIIALASSLVLITLFRYILTFAQLKASENTDRLFSSSVMVRLINLPSSFFSRYSPAELNNIITNLSMLPALIIQTALSAGTAILTLLIFTPQLFFYSKNLFPAALSVLIAQAGFSIYAIAAEKKYIDRALTVEEKLYSINHSLLSGIAKIKYCGAEKRALSRWLFEYRDKVDNDQHPPIAVKYASAILNFVSAIGYLHFYIIAYKHGIAISAFIGFSISFAVVSSMIGNVIGSIETFANIAPVFDHAYEFLNAETAGQNKIFVTEVTGKIEFTNVSFTYPGQTTKILDNVSFTVNPGEYVAIAGKTGIGKSTIFRLLLGFEKPQSGAIYIDDKDINTMNMASLRKHFGTVLQNNRLLPGDILSNIKITNPNASDEQVREACRIANFDNDLEKMPFGLNTNIGENGGNLSGGQIQRLMIARALLSHPDILIFDEAMGALDYKSQKNISEALEKLTCTRILVSHRLSTIRHCDRILVLDGGKIAASGTFDELDANSPVFKEIIRKQ